MGKEPRPCSPAVSERVAGCRAGESSTSEPRAEGSCEWSGSSHFGHCTHDAPGGGASGGGVWVDGGIVEDGAVGGGVPSAGDFDAGVERVGGVCVGVGVGGGRL